MARRLSDYQVFMSAALRAVRSRDLGEMRQAMRQAAAAWRAQHRAPNPPSQDGPERLPCPHCGAPLEVPAAVRAGRCSACGGPARVVR